MTSSTHLRAAGGGYQLDKGWPPIRPDVMNRIVADLSMEEIETLPTVVAGYNAKMTAWRDNTSNQESLVKQLRADLETDFDMTNHAKADILWRYTLTFTGQYDGTSVRAMQIATKYEELHKLVA